MPTIINPTLILLTTHMTAIVSIHMRHYPYLYWRHKQNIWTIRVIRFYQHYLFHHLIEWQISHFVFSLGVQRSQAEEIILYPVWVTPACSAQLSGDNSISGLMIVIIIFVFSAPWRGLWRLSPSGTAPTSPGRRRSDCCRTRRSGWVEDWEKNSQTNDMQT